jgi:hypothetical protein
VIGGKQQNRQFFKRYSLYMLMMCFILFSCNQTSVSEDAEAYCNCLMESNGSARTNCVGLLEELKTKYEFSPDETDELIKGIKECMKVDEE